VWGSADQRCPGFQSQRHCRLRSHSSRPTPSDKLPPPCLNRQGAVFSRIS
jgi:hypothetical protein